jgi:hypothetical protein
MALPFTYGNAVTHPALQGTPPILIIGAIMNKLLHIIFSVLKHQKPFDPDYLKNHEKTA